MKWHPTCYEMAPDKVENGAQCCLSKLYSRLFIPKFFVKAVCILFVSFPHSHFKKLWPILLQVLHSLSERCVQCAINHERDLRENNTHIYVV